MKNIKLKKIVLTFMLCGTFILALGNNHISSALINEKGDKYYIIASLQGFNDEKGIAKCNCGISFKQHKEDFESQYNKAFSSQNTNNIICDCGGVLKEKLLNIGELNYSSSNECIHNKNGCDYLYKKRTIISYTCEKCNSYFEVDIYDNQLECNGI